MFFVGVLKVTDLDLDPDPYQNVTDPTLLQTLNCDQADTGYTALLNYHRRSVFAYLIMLL
jgi:hypothetical protein